MRVKKGGVWSKIETLTPPPPAKKRVMRGRGGGEIDTQPPQPKNIETKSEIPNKQLGRGIFDEKSREIKCFKLVFPPDKF